MKILRTLLLQILTLALSFNKFNPSHSLAVGGATCLERLQRSWRRVPQWGSSPTELVRRRLADLIDTVRVESDMSNFTKTNAGRDLALGMQALKRLAQPDDIGGVVAFLASEDAR